VIAYFDTSAIVPLVIDEPGTATAGRLWDTADRIVTIRLTRVEARAALARGTRLGRLVTRQLQRATTGLDNLFGQLDLVEIDDDLTERAGDLAEAHALGPCDAIHLAAALRLGRDEAILVTGDRELVSAASASRLPVAAIA
jgi:uncharacterized protein